MTSWFEENPGRLQRELDALEASGLTYAIDEEVKVQGVLRVHVERPSCDGVVKLTATYPDVFPYFKPGVTGPDLGYEHHHNPATGEYCLLASGRGAWTADDTLAWLVTEQWDKVVAANATPSLTAGTPAADGHAAASTAGDEEAVDLRDLEEAQAEPFSAYLRDEDRALLVLDGALEVPDHGPASGLAGALLTGERPLRGFVTELADATGHVRIAGPVRPPTLAENEPRQTVGVRWVRLARAPRSTNPDDWWFAACDVDKTLADEGWHAAPPGSVGGSVKDRMQLVLVAFPEEVGHRAVGQGWVALVRRRHTPRSGATPPRLVQVSRAGHGDLFRREPRLRHMADAKILLIGLGGLGGQIASLLGNTCPDTLLLWDGDRMDPATAVRANSAFARAGEPKASVAAGGVHATQPYTQLRAVVAQLGLPRANPEDPASDNVAAVLREAISNVGLVIDATADYSVQHLLSDYSRHAGTAYLRTEALPGVWAGLIALQRPEADVCWVCWQHYLTDGTLPRLPEDQGQFVQPPGCAAPTYTGAGFDLAAIGAQTVRVAVSYLTGSDGYGEQPHDVMTVRFRDKGGQVLLPAWTGHRLERHPSCGNHT